MSEYNSIYVTIGYRKLLPLLESFHDTGLYFSQLLVWVKNIPILEQLIIQHKHELIIYGWKGRHEFYGDFDTTDVGKLIKQCLISYIQQ